MIAPRQYVLALVRPARGKLGDEVFRYLGHAELELARTVGDARKFATVGDLAEALDWTPDHSIERPLSASGDVRGAVLGLIGS